MILIFYIIENLINFAIEAENFIDDDSNENEDKDSNINSINTENTVDHNNAHDTNTSNSYKTFEELLKSKLKELKEK